MRIIFWLCLGSAFAHAAGPPPVPVDRHGDPLPPGVVARLGSTRFREPNGCHHVTYSPDGKLLASTGYGTVLLWDAATGRRVAVLRLAPKEPGEYFSPSRLAFSPDGRHLAAGPSGGPVHLWDLRDLRAEPRVLRELKGETRFLAFVKGGRELLVAEESRVRVLDLAPGGKTRTLLQADDKSKHMFDFAVSSDGKILAFLQRLTREEKDKQTIHLLDVQTGGMLAPLKAESVSKTFFTRHGLRFVAQDKFDIRIIDAKSQKELHRWSTTDLRFFANIPGEIAVSPDGKQVVFNRRLWHCETGEVVDLGRYFDWPAITCFSPDGKRLACSNNGHALEFWDVTRPQPARVMQSLGHYDEVLALAFSRDGKQIATGGKDGTVRLWNAATGEQLWVCPLPHVKTIRCLAFSRDGASIAVGGHAEGVGLLATATGKLRLLPTELSEGRNPYVWELAFGASGKTLYGSVSEGIIEWDVESGRFRVLHDAEGRSINGYAFSPDGRFFMAGQKGGGLLYDHKGKWIRSLHTPQAPRPQDEPNYCFSPDGTRVFAVLADHVRIWRTFDGIVSGAAHNPGEKLSHSRVAISPDNRMMAACCDDGWTRIWEVDSGLERRRLHTPGDQGSVAFSPDGKMLAVAGRSAAVLIHRVDHAAPAFAPDATESRRLWEALAGPADEAYRAVCDLSAHPQVALPLIARRLRPAPPVDLKRLIEELGDDEFAVRERASARLRELGFAIRDKLVKARDTTDDLETRQRIDRLLRLPILAPEADTLRGMRAIEVLERIGGPETIRLLTKMAEGDEAMLQTQHAKEALARLRGSKTD